MPRIAYERINFSEDSRLVIQRANAIIADYQQQGFTLTLRQLYYQFVARGLLANKDANYKRLGSIVNDARMAGMIDWEAIEDRTRSLRSLGTWDHPGDILDAVAEQFRFDLWEDQPVRPEVWIEKDALTGVIEPMCNRLRVSYFACRGYNSQSNQWEAGQRIKDRYERFEQKTLILHLGDHDPSGIDMSRDNDERLAWLNQATFATKADEDACRAAILALHERRRAEVERLTREKNKAEHDVQSVIRSANALASQLEHQRDAAESALAAAEARVREECAQFVQAWCEENGWPGNLAAAIRAGGGR